MPDIAKTNPSEVVDPLAPAIVGLLERLNLPSAGIIADAEERRAIGENLDRIVAKLPVEHRQNAIYLSKFIVGAGFGLFDYSLNAIWNEVVISLRSKASMYGIDIFFDAAVGGSKRRDAYVDEEDLPSLKDNLLLDTCVKLELISEVTHKKLKHILDMRNEVGISHPNDSSISAFELPGWLNVCVVEVLNDNPTEAALRVKSFIGNLKESKAPFDEVTIKTVESALSKVPTHLCGNILRTVFGIFCASETDPGVRANISKISIFLWNQCNDNVKYKLGMVLEGYRLNLQQDKLALGEQFLKLVDGNQYRSETDRTIVVDGLLDDLWEKHNGWDNFVNEVSPARQLSSYIKDQNGIHPSFSEKLFRVVAACRIGRGISYCDGVSPRARSFYDGILSLAGDQFAPLVMASLTHRDVTAKVHKGPIAREHAKDVLKTVRAGVVDLRLQECLDYLIARIVDRPDCMKDPDFRKMAAGFLGPKG